MDKSKGYLKNKIDADLLILCGGLGTRLRSAVPDRPKALAVISGEPFLYHILAYLEKWKFNKIILTLGYKGEEIKQYVQSIKKKIRNNIEFVEEDIPRGTGGAIKNSADTIKTDFFFVLNGDTASNVDFMDLSEFHKKNKALLSMALAKTNQNHDGGVVTLGSNRRIRSFQEKKHIPKVCFINAGVYCMSKTIMDHIPEHICSLENDVLPAVVSQPCFGYIKKHQLWDIGTPDRYKDAQNKIQGILYHQD